MENYEEKYKNALERARILQKANPDEQAIQAFVEDAFPELKQSKDENILREIKRYIKEQGDKPTGLPNGSVSVADMLAWLEKQKPVEWSEENEEKINKLFQFVQKIEDFQGIPNRFEEYKEMLKSLRPQKQWKPSEQQMKALKDAVDEHWEPDGLDPLYTLYNNLKKLM